MKNVIIETVDRHKGIPHCDRVNNQKSLPESVVVISHLKERKERKKIKSGEKKEKIKRFKKKK